MTDIIKQLKDAVRSAKHPLAGEEYRKQYGESPLVLKQRALTVLLKIADGDDWFPIDSAPRDKDVLTYFKGEHNVAFYREGNGWMISDGGGFTTLSFTPTHWKPLSGADHIKMLLEKEMSE